MGTVVTIGLDIAKSIFQVHGVDAAGEVVIRRRLVRRKLLEFFADLPACLVGVEACASAHYWGRELRKLGHDVRLMPPAYVKPYVKRQKNDAADAEAICEAVTRPTMRFVKIKSCEQQSVMGLHRVRLMLMRQRIQLSNAIRGHLGEYGLVAPVGRNGLAQLIGVLGDIDDDRIPDETRASLALLVSQLNLINEQILETDRRVRASARSTDVGRRLMEVPGVGPVLASAIVSSRSSSLQDRQKPRRLDRPRAASELKRWQGEARRHHQARRPILAPAACGWRSRRHPLRTATWDAAPLAGSVARPSHNQDRGSRPRQQNGADDLGHHDEWRTLPGAPSRHSVRAKLGDDKL